MPNTFVFRVDGGQRLGAGHVYRSLALADTLRQMGHRVVWVTRAHRGNFIPFLRRQGYEVFILPRGDRFGATPLPARAHGGTEPAMPLRVPPGSAPRFSPAAESAPATGRAPTHFEWLGAPPRIDAYQTLRVLAEHRIRPDHVVVDHYAIDVQWEACIRPHVGRIIVIDDLANRYHDCDLLLDATPGRTHTAYRHLVPDTAQLLLGGAYALVRSDFAALREYALARRRHNGGSVQKLLVSCGGVDADDLTSRVLQALQEIGFSGELDVVMGRNAAHLQQVETRLREWFPAARLHVGTDQMAQLVADADLAVGTGGHSSWERCALGLPALIITTATNQEALALALAAHGAATYAGRSGTLAVEHLASQLEAALNDAEGLVSMSEQAAFLCDGLGAPRVALHLHPVRARDGTPVSLRTATFDDLEQVYRWQTDPRTREFARDPRPPAYEEHKAWFLRRLGTPGGHFFIIEYGHESAGVVRCDPTDDPASLELSIFVDPAFYRRGIALAALKTLRRLLPWATLYAGVHPENEASRRLFAKAGYVRIPGGFISHPAPEGLPPLGTARADAVVSVDVRDTPPSTTSASLSSGVAQEAEENLPLWARITAGPPWIVAELSGNHNQSLDQALQLIEAAAAAGVDAVKLQTYTADSMTLDLDHGPFRIGAEGTPWDGETLYNLYKKGSTPREWHEPLFRRAAELGLVAFSTPFDGEAVEFLESLGVPVYKIASFELTDLPLIARAAATGKPLILSTGMASLAEIDEAVRTAREAGCRHLVLLKCTSSYPASPAESHLLTIPHMRQLFGCPVGLSDHTPGIGVAVAATALGATVIEKHLTLDRAEGGIDAAFSLEPDEMKRLVTEVRRAWEARGQIRYGPLESEAASLRLRRSLYVVENLQAGDVLNEHNVRSIRPAGGLLPKYRSIVLGRRVCKAVPKGTPLTWNLLLGDAVSERDPAED